MALEKEMDTYRRELPNLLAHEGKFVVIQGDAVIGTYATYEDALNFGYDKCGLAPFLVKKVEAVEQAQWFTRDIDVCPS